MPYAGVNGQRLYYEVGGDGETIVLLHGYLADADSMEAPATGLATGLRAIRIDRRGHGRSSPAEAPAPLAVEVADIAALLNWFSVDKVHFLAHDEGAEVAIEFALTHPERALSLALLSPTVEGYPWSPEEMLRQHGLREALKKDATKALAERWSSIPLFDAPPESLDMIERLKGLFSRMAGGVSGWERPHRDGPTQFERLSQIQAKTGVFVGAKDEPERLRCAEAIAQGVPGAELHALPALSRFLHAEDSRAVMRRLTDFFMPEPEIERLG